MKNFLIPLQALLFVFGLGMLISVEWKVATGFLFLLWANNLTEEIKKL